MLVKKLCRIFPSERLGCQKGGVRSIIAHPWFADIEWGQLREQKLEAPYKPEVESNTDTRHFDKFNADSSDPPEDFSEWDQDF